MTTTISLPTLLPGLLELVRVLGLFFGVLGVLVLILRLLYVLFRTVTSSLNRGLNGMDRSHAQRTEGKVLAQARKAGEEDMRTAWLQWQLRLDPTATRAKALSPSALGSSALDVLPRPDWTVDRLRRHGREVWEARHLAVTPRRRQEVDARLDWVAAMVYELSDAPFDATRGQTTEQYLYHQDREVREAYLKGGSAAAEKIMDTITAARDRARQDAATDLSAEFLAQQRNTAFQAMRETYRPTRTRDAHAAWEAEAGGEA